MQEIFIEYSFSLQRVSAGIKEKGRFYKNSVAVLA